ncbi:hypothetical protein [Micromonospora sp. ALFpr18c]|uniref:hypothetical protein n=1 Tax=unclassified Micromonospora TaxID=2617518 RepID=UPI001788AEEA|nr:hypothetical protein [Micromonospora sp. ALFpr18c]
MIDSTAAVPSQPSVPTWYRAVTASADDGATAGALDRPGDGEAVVTRGDGDRLLRDGPGDAVRRSTPAGVGPPVGDTAAGTVGRNTGGAARGPPSLSLVRNDSNATTNSTTSTHTPSSTTTHGTDANMRAARTSAAPSGRTAIRSPLVPTDAPA